jgi:hypothetical protein
MAKKKKGVSITETEEDKKTEIKPADITEAKPDEAEKEQQKKEEERERELKERNEALIAEMQQNLLTPEPRTEEEKNEKAKGPGIETVEDISTPSEFEETDIPEGADVVEKHKRIGRGAYQIKPTKKLGRGMTWVSKGR